MLRQSLISLPQTKLDPLRYPSQSSNPLIHFTFWEHLSLTDIDHMSQYRIRCDKALHRMKVYYLPRQYQNMKHSNYVDVLASIPMGKHSKELGDIVGTLLILHALQSPISRVMQCSYLPYVGRDTPQSSSLYAKVESIFLMSLRL